MSRQSSAPQLLCQFGECRNPAKSRGWCSTHYSRWHRHGDPGIVIGAYGEPVAPLSDDERCDVIGCERRAKITGMCPTHYQRKRRHGSVDVVLRPGRHPSLNIPHTLCAQCDNVQFRAGLCQRHYQEIEFCAEPGCTNKHLHGKPRCILHQTIETCNQHLGYAGWCLGRVYRNGMCLRCYNAYEKAEKPWLSK